MRGALILASLLALAGCGRETPSVQAGDAENGKLLLRQFGCGKCHEIPGVADARGRVGPPLEGVADRVYLAGVLANTPLRRQSQASEIAPLYVYLASDESSFMTGQAIVIDGGQTIT